MGGKSGKPKINMNDAIVDLLGCLTQCFGGSLGLAILTLSLGVRFALLPLSIKLAKRARRNQEILQTLQPEIEQLKKRFEKKPERLFAEMRELYRKHHYNPLDIPAMLAGFIQLPIFAILYRSIRSVLSSHSAFLWIKNLAIPDVFLTLAILFVTGLCAYLMPSASEQARYVLITIQVVITCLIVWKLAAGLALYWVSSGLVNLIQTLWLRHHNGSRQNRLSKK
jgi:YidC/Oxa1 family membrane protein insertase